MSKNEPETGGSTPPPATPYGAPTAPGLPPESAPASKKPIFKRWWFWALAIVAVIIVITVVNSGGGSDKPSGGTTPTAAPTAGETSAPAEPEETLPGIGDKVVIEGLEITVTSIETGRDSVGSGGLSEKAQGAFTLLGVSITNVGTTAETVISSSFIVLDDAAREFESSLTASLYLGGSGFAFEKINPGNTASGILVFDLPKGTDPKTLRFTPGFFGPSVEIDLTKK